jgi:2-phospho-L-lactate/phosphoenolpyruvate guanylyltransferase
MPSSDPRASPTTVLIPLRSGGKHRLSEQLDAAARWSLCVAMLDDVVVAVRAAGLADVRIIASGDAAVEAATARGLPVVRDRADATIASHAAPRPDPGPGPDLGAEGLRRAVDDGLAVIGSTGVRIVLAADLPLLTSNEITELLATSDRVTVAPTRDGGTGALLLPAGATIPALYGRGSAAAHLNAARGAGLATVELDRTGFAIDVDSAIDLRTVIAIVRMGTAPGGAGCGAHTTAALHALGVLDAPRATA